MSDKISNTTFLYIEINIPDYLAEDKIMTISIDRHVPFNGLFFRTAWVNRHQKGQTSLDCNKARDDGVEVASSGPYANHLHLAPDR